MRLAPASTSAIRWLYGDWLQPGGEVRQLLLAQHAELKGQAAHMAQSELQFCANAFADKLAYSDIARAVNNDTRPDIMRHQQSCPELGELTMLLGEFTFTPAGATYLGER